MYNEIVQELSDLNHDYIIKIVLSKSKCNIQKAMIRPVLIKQNKKWQIERIINNQAFHDNTEYQDLGNSFLSLLKEYAFCEINIILKEKVISYRISKKNKILRNEHNTI